ncbi:hypothetical protein ABFY19_03150 [Phosphitispora sp. TUW77]
MKHLVSETLTELVGDIDYYLCMDEDCDVVYYDSDAIDKGLSI